jgi:transposase
MEGEQRVLVGAGVPLAHFAVGDRMAEANAMVLLVEQGWAAQNDVARAFGVSTRTVRRQQRRYDEGGLARLARGVGYPRGRPRLPSRDRAVSKLKADGLSNRAIAERLGIDEKSVRKRLRRLGWKPAAPAQLRLAGVAAGADPNLSAPAIAPDEISSQEGGDSADPNVSAFATSTAETEPVAESADFDPADRRLDRFLAHVGLLDDAAPLFRDGRAVPGAGVLLALPSLVESGVFAAARNVWGSTGSTTSAASRSWWSPPRPTPAWSRCCPGCSGKSAGSSVSAA